MDTILKVLINYILDKLDVQNAELAELNDNIKQIIDLLDDIRRI